MNRRSAFCRARNIKTRAYVYGYYCGDLPETKSGEQHSYIYSREYGKSLNGASYKIKTVDSSTIEFTCPITDKKGKRLFEGDYVIYNGVYYILVFNEDELCWCLGWNNTYPLRLVSSMSSKITLVDAIIR